LIKNIRIAELKRRISHLCPKSKEARPSIYYYTGQEKSGEKEKELFIIILIFNWK
jgi:hypothetical protein